MPMRALPRAGAMHIAHSKETAQGARYDVHRLVVMAADGRALVGGTRESQPVQDVHAAAPVSAAVTPGSLAKVVEQAGHGDAVGRNTPRMLQHILIHLQRVLGQTAVLLVVAVAAALEVGRCKKIVDHGLHPGPPRFAQYRADSVSDFSHCTHVGYI